MGGSLSIFVNNHQVVLEDCLYLLCDYNTNACDPTTITGISHASREHYVFISFFFNNSGIQHVDPPAGLLLYTYL